MTSLNSMIEDKALRLMAMAPGMTKAQAITCVFESLDPETRELAKMENRPATAQERSFRKAAINVHREMPDSDRDRRGYGADDAPVERDESPTAKLGRMARKMRDGNPVKYKTPEIAFAAACETPEGRELMRQDKARRGIL